MRRPTQTELDLVGYSIGVELPGEQLRYWTPQAGDPTATPAKAAAHAHNLIATLAEHDRRREAERAAR